MSISQVRARSVRRPTLTALLLLVAVALAMTAAALVFAHPEMIGAGLGAVTQVAPTPAPDPSVGNLILEWRLWLLGGLGLAAVVAFAIIARLSRGYSGQ